MERWKSVLKKLLRPGAGWVLLAVVLSGASLALTFLVFGSESPLAYASYVLSAYGLTVLTAAIVPGVSSARELVRSVPLAHQYMTDHYFKVCSGLVLSFFINLCYAGFKLVCAIWFVSLWDGALAVYYVLLCVVRLCLICRVPPDGRERDMARELRCCRATGVFLLLLDLVLGGVAAQIVRDGHGSSYPGTLIYAAALHAFYSLTLAIVNTVKYRKFHNPVLSAAKAVNLTTALVSIFNLETAMLTQFGEGDERFRQIMTTCTASAVCLTVLGTAILMVVSSNRTLRRLST